MDSIFNYKKSEEDDYYRILGCDETSNVCRTASVSTIEQIIYLNIFFNIKNIK